MPNFTPLIQRGRRNDHVNGGCPEDHGIVIGGQRIWNIRYADDITLLEQNKEHLVSAVISLQAVSLEYGLKINEKKTQMMVMDADETIEMNGTDIEKVVRFRYLGSMCNMEGNSEEDIRK